MLELKNIYKKISQTMIVCALLVLIFFVFQPTKLLGITLFSVIVIACLILFSLVYKATTMLPGKIPVKYFFTGIFLIVGGACFDVVMTVVHSPDLALEANPFIRFFIGIEMPLKQVYLVGIFGQLLYVTLISLLWASFLKAYPMLIKGMKPCGIINTIVKMYGGLNASTLDLFLNRVDYFYYINSIIPIVVASSFYRWYLALEWLGWVPISRIIAPVTICLLGLIGYIAFSRRLIERDSNGYPLT